MAWELPRLICSYLIICGLTRQFCAALDCGNNPCLCNVSEEKYLNLSNLKANVTVGNLTYTFYGCKNVKTDNCGDTTLCLKEKQGTNETVWVNLGDEHSMKIEPAKIGGLYDIVYKQGNHTSRLGLICTENFNETLLTPKNVSDKQNPNLYIFSKHACLVSVAHHKGMSTGGTLVVLFLVGIIIYFVGGAIVLYGVRGARGREMIPNIDFWQNLPGLVKDGLIFVLNGCRPTAVPTAESYDRI